MGLHWIYDTSKIQTLLASAGRTQGAPEFFEPPACPWYSYASGQLSPYGDELVPVLTYLAEHGTMTGQSFAEYLAAYYKAYPGRLNKTSKQMMEAIQGGTKWPDCGDKEDMQANAFVKVIPIVALLAGRPGLESAVDAAVRAQQDNDGAVAFALAAARILERVVLGADFLENAIRSAAAAIPSSAHDASSSSSPASSAGGRHHSAAAAAGAAAAAAAAVHLNLQEVVQAADRGTAVRDLLYAPGSTSQAGAWGPSCKNPGALQGALLAVLQANGSYVGGVRANMALGGDNCSRGVLLGALLAAGGGQVPPEWQAKVLRYEELERQVDRLLAHRPLKH